MAINFSIKTQEANRGKDGKYPVMIRMYHNGRCVYFKTIYRVPKSALTKSYELKDPYILKECAEIINQYEEMIKKRGNDVSGWSAHRLKNFLLKKYDNDALDLISFAERLMGQMRKSGRIKPAENYRTAINSFKQFIGRSNFAFSELSSKVLREFEAWLIEKNLKRAPSLYTTILRSVFNKAIDEYNDEDGENVVIKNYPFKKYKIPKAGITQKRALDAKKIVEILKYRPIGRRDELARDVFMLSFFFVGMNSIDLYNCMPATEGVLSYERTKTKNIREDRAFISIRIEPEAVGLIERYRDDKRMFDFYRRYSTPYTFNAAINKGLKIIGKKIGINDLEFYAARHSWATIAQNDCGISKSDVHEFLNHVDEKLKTTDIYIKKDWSRIAAANRVVINYVLPTQPTAEIQKTE